MLYGSNTRNLVEHLGTTIDIILEEEHQKSHVPPMPTRIQHMKLEKRPNTSSLGKITKCVLHPFFVAFTEIF
jgi:hypothetical protein